MTYNEPTYVSDGDVYYSSDYNNAIVDNIIELRKHASSDISVPQKFSTDVLFGSGVEFTTDLLNLAWASDMTIDMNAGNNHLLYLQGNTTITITATGVTKATIMIQTSSDGDDVITWDSDVYWAGGVAHVQSTDALAWDVVSLVNYDSLLMGVYTTNFGKV